MGQLALPVLQAEGRRAAAATAAPFPCLVAVRRPVPQGQVRQVVAAPMVHLRLHKPLAQPPVSTEELPPTMGNTDIGVLGFSYMLL